jgi:hypothetical protein
MRGADRRLRGACALALAACALGCGDSTPPVFPGVEWARLSQGGTRLDVGWTPAHDDRTAPQDVRYRVVAESERYGDPVVFEREVKGATRLSVPRPRALAADRSVTIRVIAIDEAGNAMRDAAPASIEPAVVDRGAGGERLIGSGPTWALVAAADGGVTLRRVGESRPLPALADAARAVAGCVHPEGRAVLALADGAALAELDDGWRRLDPLPRGLTELACAGEVIAAVVREPAAAHGALLWLDGGVWRDRWLWPEEDEAREAAAAALAIDADGRAIAVASDSAYELRAGGRIGAVARHAVEAPLRVASTAEGVVIASAASACPGALVRLAGAAPRTLALRRDGAPGWCRSQPLLAFTIGRGGVAYFASATHLLANSADGFVEVWARPIVRVAGLPAGGLLVETPDGVLGLRWPD